MTYVDRRERAHYRAHRWAAAAGLIIGTVGWLAWKTPPFLDSLPQGLVSGCLWWCLASYSGHAGYIRGWDHRGLPPTPKLGQSAHISREETPGWIASSPWPDQHTPPTTDPTPRRRNDPDNWPHRAWTT